MLYSEVERKFNQLPPKAGSNQRPSVHQPGWTKPTDPGCFEEDDIDVAPADTAWWVSEPTPSW